MNDFHDQVSFVSRSVDRILWQIDKDPLSVSFGCPHLGYWRDKTSDVSDARHQEVAYALALLYTRDYPGSSWKGNERLRKAILALIRNWIQLQYPDGTFDEWYVGERAFAAAAFGTFAMSRALVALAGLLPTGMERELRDRLSRTSDWLCRNDDLFKTNHQAVGSAALASASVCLARPELARHAKRKIRSIIGVQTPEGWFPEIGGMDVGYSFLTAEYVGMAMEILHDWSFREPFRKAFEFACQLVQPDLTVCHEAGICRNPYLSRIASVLFADVSGYAARLVGRFESEVPGFRSYANVLGDDLRLMRWSFQPLLAYDIWQERLGRGRADPAPLPLETSTHGLKVFPQAGIACLKSPELTGLVLVSKAGELHLFGPAPSGVRSIDTGYALGQDGSFAVNMIRPGGKADAVDDRSISVSSGFMPVKKFFPPYWARVVLRLLSSTRFGSRLARRGIDFIRLRKGTPVNQSSGNLLGGPQIGNLKRTIRFDEGLVSVQDAITLDGPASPDRFFRLAAGDGEWPGIEPIPGLPPTFTNLLVQKEWRFAEGEWRFTLRCRE